MDNMLLCPVCGRYRFEKKNSFEICPYCKWENDEIQRKDPEYIGGANNISLNEYKEQYNAMCKLIGEGK